MPSWGAAPAWASLPRYFTSLPTKPEQPAPTAVNWGVGAPGIEWTIIAMSTSSKAPSAISCCLPPKNSILPSRSSFSRYSSSTNSSAGTAMKTASPSNCSIAPERQRPMAAPNMVVIWALWPQAWAAPVCLSALGCRGETTASNSPITATVARWSRPAARALTPVRASSF